MVEFYDANMNLLYEFHTSTSHPSPFTGTYSYEKIMNIASGDTDGDGNMEVLVIARTRDTGVYLMEWNGSTFTWVWRYAGPATAYQRGVEIGNFSSNSSGKEVAFGNNEGYVYILSKTKSLLATLNLGQLSGYVGGKTVQNIRAADATGNGIDEMYIATGRTPGRVWKFEYESSTFKLRWYKSVTALSGSGDNCYEIWPHASGNPSGGWGIGGATEQETGTVQGSMFVMDMNGTIKWQTVHDSNAPRGGGAEFKDMNGDGLPDLMTRGTGGTLGSVTYIRDRSGNLLSKENTPDGGTAGPPCLNYQADGTLEVGLWGTLTEFWKVNAFASAPDFQVAHGVISLTTSWQTFSLPAGFNLPIVVFGPTTNNDSAPVIARLRNVTSSSFEAKLQEWDYQDNVHATEAVHWMAVERGTWDLGGGKYLIARDAIIWGDDVGYVLTYGGGITFPAAPAAIATLATANESSAVIARISGTSTTAGVTIRLQEEELQGAHNGEIVNYIACDTTVTSIGGYPVQVYRSPAVEVDENPFPVSTSFGTCNVWLQEEQSADSEVDHVVERFAYIAFEGSPFLVGNCVTRNEADTCVLRCDSP
jgi:hypothetical protein